MINGIFSDELTRDYRTFLELVSSFPSARVELRNLRTGRIPLIADEELDELCTLVSPRFPITSLSPGICKSTYEAARLDETTLVRRSIDIAKRLNARKITIFGFRRSPGDNSVMPAPAFELFLRCAEAIVEAGLAVSIENWQSSYVRTGTDFVALLDRARGLPIGLDWDPCNAHAAGVSEPHTELSVCLQHVSSIQVKDAIVKDGKQSHARVGQGAVGWDSIVKAMLEAGYSGDVTLESHASCKVRDAMQDWEAFNQLFERVREMS